MVATCATLKSDVIRLRHALEFSASRAYPLENRSMSGREPHMSIGRVTFDDASVDRWPCRSRRDRRTA
jgi:hypothetical protein